MSELIDLILASGVFATILLLPGFVTFFIPYRIVARKMRYTTFELTLGSLVASLVIFVCTFITYWVIRYIGILYGIFSLNEILISTITIELFDNAAFFILFFVWTIIFIGVGFFIIPQDRAKNLRNFLTGRNKEKLINAESMWDEMHDKSDRKGFVVVETKNAELIVGFVIEYSDYQNVKEILLKYPERYSIDTLECKPIPNVEYILFRDEDIKRIYFMSETELEEETKL